MTDAALFEGNRLAARAADLFDFSAIAERMARSMAEQTGEDCFVIGLEGEWGSGKSTLLSFLEDDLRGRGASVVRFAPWTIGSRDALLAQLFAVLEKAVAIQNLAEGDATDETVRTAREGLAGFRRYAGAIAALGRAADVAGALGVPLASLVGGATAKVAESLEKGLGETPLEELKERTSKALRGLAHRLVVLIDDLDRLEPREAVEVLRLVQAVADFPNVSYVLSYDRRRLADGISSVVGVKDGAAFLEKLVQVVVPVPHPQPVKLVDMFTRRLKAVTGREELGDALAAIVKRHIGPRIRTPRGIVRVVDGVRMLWPALDGRVNLDDLVWLQFVRAEDDRLYRWIETYAAEAASPQEEATVEESRRRMASSLDVLLASSASGLAWTEIRQFLPMAGEMAGNAAERLFTAGTRDQVLAAQRGMRLSSVDHARLYFGLVPPEGRTATREYEALLAAASDPAAVATALRSVATVRSLSGPAQVELVFDLLSASIPQLDANKRRGISMGILAVVDDLIRTAPVSDRSVFRQSVSQLLGRLIDGFAEEAWTADLGIALTPGTAVDFLMAEIDLSDKGRPSWMRSDAAAELVRGRIADFLDTYEKRNMVNWAASGPALRIWKWADPAGRECFLREVYEDDRLFEKLIIGLHDGFVTRGPMPELGRHAFGANVDEYWGYDRAISRMRDLLDVKSSQRPDDLAKVLATIEAVTAS